MSLPIFPSVFLFPGCFRGFYISLKIETMAKCPSDLYLRRGVPLTLQSAAVSPVTWPWSCLGSLYHGTGHLLSWFWSIMQTPCLQGQVPPFAAGGTWVPQPLTVLHVSPPAAD